MLCFLRTILRASQFFKSTKKSKQKTVQYGNKIISKKQFTHLGIDIDLDKRQIKINDEDIFFRNKEFDLIYLLMSNPGKVFTREILVQDIWGFEYLGDTRTVDVHIRWIREKIEENSKIPQKIITVRGVGYKSNVD